MTFIFHLYFQGEPLIEDQKHSFSPHTSLKMMPILKCAAHLRCLFPLSLVELSVPASFVAHPYLNIRKKCPLLIFTIWKTVLTFVSGYVSAVPDIPRHHRICDINEITAINLANLLLIYICQRQKFNVLLSISWTNLSLVTKAQAKWK